VAKVNSNAISLPVLKVIFDASGVKLPEPRMLDLYQSSEVFIERPVDMSPPQAFTGHDLNPAD
jgi:hypothetical protein